MYTDNIISFLKPKIGNLLQKMAYSFCNENINDINYFFGHHQIKYVRVESISFQNISLYLKSNGIVFFLISFCPELITNCYENGENEEYSTNGVWLDCLCEGNLDKNLSFIKIIEVDFHKHIKPSGCPLGQNLMLQLRRNDYERIAKFYLDKYECKGSDGLKKMISALGFSIITKSFCDKKGKVLGKTYFNDSEDYFLDNAGNATCETIRSCTVVVDYEANRLLSRYSVYSTLAHELSHIILHKYIRKLIFIFGNETNKTISYNEMEAQANILASYFLLPRQTFSEIANSKLTNLEARNIERPRIYELLINELSMEFKVSKYVVKKVLFNLGHKYVKGIFECIDGHVLRNYSFASDNMGQSETYSLSAKDLYSLLKSDKELLDQFLSGLIVFVENHLVLNNEKYLLNSDSGPLLTDYALMHLDECAYKFMVCFSGEIIGNEYESIFFSPNRILPAGSRLSSQCPQCGIFKNAFELNVSQFGKRKRDIMGILNANTFGEGLREIMYYLNIDQKSLALDSDLDDTTISRYLNNKKREFNKNTIVALAIGLHLEPELSTAFLSFAGITLTNRKDDDCFNWALTYCYKYNVRRVNELLAKQGYPPLTKEKI